MKINLLLGGGDVRGGYVNVDPLCRTDDPDRRRAPVLSLDWLVEDAEATDIVALDVIDFVECVNTDVVVDHWVAKLRHGGTITVGGVDLREVARSLVSQQIGVDLANALLYGLQDSPSRCRKATMTMQLMISVFESRGLKVEAKRFMDYHYYVTARRP